MLLAMFEINLISPETSTRGVREEECMMYIFTLLYIVMRSAFIVDIGLETEGGTELGTKKGL